MTEQRQQQPQQQPWHILGAGAIGTLWACNLCTLGWPVTLILRSQEKLDSFKTINAIRLAITAYPVSAELADADAPIRQLLITTKSIDTEQALNSIRHRITPGARVIVLQNGMGSQQWVKTQLPEAEVAWASTTDGAWLKAPFELVHAGKGLTRIGAAEQTYNWLSALQGGLLAVELDPQIEMTLWRKLAINCAINPLTAYYQCQNGDLIRVADYLDEMHTLCQEVETVAIAEGITLFDTPLIEQACQVAEITAQNYSSMLQDVRNGRQTEISHITGYLCQRAQQHGINVPLNQLYLERIKKMHERNQ